MFGQNYVCGTQLLAHVLLLPVNMLRYDSLSDGRMLMHICIMYLVMFAARSSALGRQFCISPHFFLQLRANSVFLFFFLRIFQKKISCSSGQIYFPEFTCRQAVYIMLTNLKVEVMAACYNIDVVYSWDFDRETYWDS